MERGRAKLSHSNANQDAQGATDGYEAELWGISRGKNVDIPALDQALVRRDKGQIECLCSGGDETVCGVAMRKVDGRAHQHHIHREGNF